MATAPVTTGGSEETSEALGGPFASAPELFERYFAFFRPGHQEGILPCRIKELARLKIASLNDCDT